MKTEYKALQLAHLEATTGNDFGVILNFEKKDRNLGEKEKNTARPNNRKGTVYFYKTAALKKLLNI